MEIPTIIIASLTLICVAIGLFLNYKSNQKLTERLNAFEEKTTQDISTTKTELKEEFNTNLDNTKSAIKNFVIETTQKSDLDLKAKIDDVDKSTSSNLASSRNDLIRAFEIKTSDLKQDIDNYKKEVRQSFEKVSTEIKAKVDSAIQSHTEQQNKISTEVSSKFDKIIEEIKTPLTID